MEFPENPRKSLKIPEMTNVYEKNRGKEKKIKNDNNFELFLEFY